MIELQPFTRSDFATLMGWIGSPEFLMQWAGPTFSYPLDEAQLENHLQQTLGPEPRLMAFKVVDVATRETVGHIELSNIDREKQRAHLSRVLVGPERLRGRGIGSEMLQAILAFGFGQLGLHRIDLVVFDFNTAAITCYERAGFRKEKLLRNARKVGDQYWNLYAMRLLRSEWAPRHD
jgi:RimJ/RimL family protein N-acetyltransferase